MDKLVNAPYRGVSFYGTVLCSGRNRALSAVVAVSRGLHHNAFSKLCYTSKFSGRTHKDNLLFLEAHTLGLPTPYMKTVQTIHGTA